MGECDAAPSNRDIRGSERASPTHEIGVEEDNYHGDIVVEMASNPTVDLLEIGVSHFSLLCRFLESYLYKPPCDSLRQKMGPNKHIKVRIRGNSGT